MSWTLQLEELNLITVRHSDCRMQCQLTNRFKSRSSGLLHLVCSVVVGYYCFGGTCCLQLQGENEGSKVLHGTTTEKIANSEVCYRWR
jgi:hypothetical protein